MDRGPIKPPDRLKSIFRRSFPISDLYLPDARSAITDNRLKTYNGTTYYYDELGNLIHRELADGEVQNYFYDLHDQLVKAEIFKKDGTKETWSYTYDALGRRIGKGRLKDSQEVSDDLSNQTRFVWEGSHLLQEIHPDGRYTYIYTDPDSYEPLAQVRDWTTADGESRQQTHYFHCGQIGIPREMTDKDGNLLWFGNYTGWGRLKEETRVTDNAYQPFRLQNQYVDRETGLHYNFFRYYEPDAGRFVNQDPIGSKGGENFYQFSTNIQNMIDPWGLNAGSVAKGVLSVIAIDIMTPNPSDAAWPKWIAYGVLISAAAATGVVALSESNTCGKCSDPPPENCRTKFPNLPLCKNLPKAYKFSSVNQIYKQFNIQNVKTQSKRSSTEGPCIGNGMHINLRFIKGNGRAGSITSCNCCDDSIGIPKVKTLFRMIP